MGPDTRNKSVRSLWPIPLILVGALSLLIPGCDKLITQVNNNTYYDSTLGDKCLRCHGDAVVDDSINRPKGQWSTSGHSSPRLIQYSSPEGTTNACGPECHTSQAFLLRDSATVTSPAVNEPAVIGCMTCHAPHTGRFITDWKIRPLRMATIPVKLVTKDTLDLKKGNQCAFCHKAKSRPLALADSVKLDASWSPHLSCQADMFLGKVGFLLEDSLRSGDSSIISHNFRSGIFADSGGCIVCHFGLLSAAGSQARGYQFGEHTFRLQDPVTKEQFVQNCNRAKCHGDAAGNPNLGSSIVDFYRDSLAEKVDTLADSLRVVLTSRRVIDTTDRSGRSFYADSTVPRDLARVLYNYLLYKLDGSRGVHNAKYTRALLQASVARIHLIPYAAFRMSADTTCVGDTVAFTDASEGLSVSRSWNFGDNSTASTDTNPRHVYTRAAAFQVKLKLTSDSGAGVDQAVHQLVVLGPPTAQIQIVAKTPTTTADTVQFRSINNPGVAWRWDFGDGVGTDTVEKPRYQYHTAGTYIVKLLLTTRCGTDSTTASITISP